MAQASDFLQVRIRAMNSERAAGLCVILSPMIPRDLNRRYNDTASSIQALLIQQIAWLVSYGDHTETSITSLLGLSGLSEQDTPTIPLLVTPVKNAPEFWPSSLPDVAVDRMQEVSFRNLLEASRPDLLAYIRTTLTLRVSNSGDEGVAIATINDSAWHFIVISFSHSEKKAWTPVVDLFCTRIAAEQQFKREVALFNV